MLFSNRPKTSSLQLTVLKCCTVLRALTRPGLELERPPGKPLQESLSLLYNRLAGKANLFSLSLPLYVPVVSVEVSWNVSYSMVATNSSFPWLRTWNEINSRNNCLATSIKSSLTAQLQDICQDQEQPLQGHWTSTPTSELGCRFGMLGFALGGLG